MALTFDEMKAEMGRPNPAGQLFREYTQFLPEYDHPTTRYRNLFWTNQFTHNPDRNTGWKIHLNVGKDNVQAVSTYLLSQDYDHKYLMGADLSDGKIFTVYLGPKSFLQKSTTLLHQQISHLLLPLEPATDIPIIGKIKGRFVGEKAFFSTKSSLRGITLPEQYAHVLDPHIHASEEQKTAAFVATNQVLQQRYGLYYGGCDFALQTETFDQVWQRTFRPKP